MSTTHELFECWRDANGHTSDRQTAFALGVDPSTITLWKRGRNGSPAVIARMARDLGLDVPATVIRAHIESVANCRDRAVWAEIANRALREIDAEISRRPRSAATSMRNSLKRRGR